VTGRVVGNRARDRIPSPSAPRPRPSSTWRSSAIPASGELRLAIGDQVEATVTDDGRRSGSIVLKRTLGRGGHVPGRARAGNGPRPRGRGRRDGAEQGRLRRPGRRRAGVSARRRRWICGGASRSSTSASGFRFRVSRIEGGRAQCRHQPPVTPRGRGGDVGREPVGAPRGRRRSSRARCRRCATFGAFVDIGGVEGLIHVSELGHTRVGAPVGGACRSEQTVEAKVARLEKPEPGGRGRISPLDQGARPGSVGHGRRAVSGRDERAGHRAPRRAVRGVRRGRPRASTAWCTSPSWRSIAASPIRGRWLSVGDEVDVTVVGPRSGEEAASPSRWSRPRAGHATRPKRPSAGKTAEVVDRTNMAQRLGDPGATCSPPNAKPK